MTKNIIFNYYKTQTLKIAENQKEYKYIVLWVDGFIAHMLRDFDLISIDLIKKELPIYFNKLVRKELTKNER